MTFTFATENTRKCYQAPFPIFRTGPGNEANETLYEKKGEIRWWRWGVGGGGGGGEKSGMEGYIG